MLQCNHVAIWIDHLQARIFYVKLTETGSLVLKSRLPTQHLHHKANTIGSGHVDDDPRFLASVGKAVGDAEHILILGPSTEKTALKHYLDANLVTNRSIRIEPADHLTDQEIIALARQHFHLQPVRHIT